MPRRADPAPCCLGRLQSASEPDRPPETRALANDLAMSLDNLSICLADLIAISALMMTNHRPSCRRPSDFSSRSRCPHGEEAGDHPAEPGGYSV